MTYYKNEYRRIGGNWKLLLFILLLLNFINVMGNISNRGAGLLRGMTGMVTEPVTYIPFLDRYVWGGLFILMFYMNGKLFFIEEQGKKVFLPLKYEITPLTPAQIYGAKIRIMLEASGWYLGIGVISYCFALLSTRYPVIDWTANLWEIGELALAGAGFLLLFLCFDALFCLYMKREW